MRPRAKLADHSGDSRRRLDPSEAMVFLLESMPAAQNSSASAAPMPPADVT